jgi:peroxiredoxin
MVLLGSNNEILKKGDKAPDFKLKGTDGNSYMLSDIKGDKLTLIVFICNHCPYVIPRLPNLNRISKYFKDKGVRVIGINSNNAEEYPEDSFENMQNMVGKGNIEFLYLYDESQEIAKAYGAVATPDPFLFDESLKLIFHSRITDAKGNEPVVKEEMYDAILEYLETKKITQNEEQSFGCSIKWKYD